MRSPSILLFIFAIPLIACSSTEGGSGDGRSPASPGSFSGEGEGAAAPAVPDVTGRQIRAEWRNLNPKYGPQHIGLINRSSPELTELYRNPGGYDTVKPVDDEVMGNILEAFRRYDFYDHAEKGRDARSYAMGDGFYVISVMVGEEKWALLRGPLSDGTSSPIPTISRDLKVLLMHVYNSTYWLRPSAPQDDRVFQVPRPKYPARR